MLIAVERQKRARESAERTCELDEIHLRAKRSDGGCDGTSASHRLSSDFGGGVSYFSVSIGDWRR